MTSKTPQQQTLRATSTRATEERRHAIRLLVRLVRVSMSGGVGSPGAKDAIVGHTTGAANDAFLAVNGSTTQGIFYEETIPVTPGDALSLSVWALNWSGGASPQIAMQAYDGTGTTLLGSANTPLLTSGNWVRSEVNFTTGANTQVVIRLKNLSTQTAGNDFAIDDFALRATAGPSCATTDTDGDGHPDYQDIDDDGDGIVSNRESQGTTYRAPTGADLDLDGLDDEYDNVCSLPDIGGASGNTDECTAVGFAAGTIITPINTDGTTQPDHLDLDSDGDGIPDNNEGQTTSGYQSPQGIDADGDGLDDAYSSTGIVPTNTDGADSPDYLDLNSDNEDGDDTVETGLALANSDVDSDGLDDAVDTSQNYSDPNGTINQTSQLPNSQDASTAEVDFRDNVPSPVGVQKTQTETALKPGDTQSYTLTITNPGPGTAGSVSVSDDLTDVLDDADYNNDVSINGPGTIAYNEPSLTYSAAVLAPNQTVTITYSVTTKNPRPTTANHTLNNRVVGPGCPVDSTSTDCVAAASVEAAPHMDVSKTAPTDPIRPGEVLTYTVVAKNDGDAPAMGYHLIDNLTDAIDDATYNNDAVADVGTISYDDPIISWTGNLQPGEVVNMTYSVTVGAVGSGNGKIINSIIDPEVIGNCGEGSTDPNCTVTTSISADGLASTGGNWRHFFTATTIALVLGSATLRITPLLT